MGGYQALKTALKNIENNTTQKSVTNNPIVASQNSVEDPLTIPVQSSNTHQTHTGATQTGTRTELFGEHTLSSIQTFGNYIFYFFLAAASIALLSAMVRIILRYIYSFFNTHRMIYLKIMLPKNDGKTDREQEKEIAKDMKEKVSRMSQLYSGLHKISELSTWESMMHKLFGKQKIVLMFQYEEGQLGFIIGTYPEYQNIIESAISAQFANCSLERVKKPEPFQKKYYDIMTLEPEKDPVYTIKTFKQVPDDPMNNIIDTMSKISTYDTVSVILVIKPEGSSYNAKRQKAADRLYKGLDLYTTNRWHWSNLLNPLNWF